MHALHRNGVFLIVMAGIAIGIMGWLVPSALGQTTFSLDNYPVVSEDTDLRNYFSEMKSSNLRDAIVVQYGAEKVVLIDDSGGSPNVEVYKLENLRLQLYDCYGIWFGHMINVESFATQDDPVTFNQLAADKCGNFSSKKDTLVDPSQFQPFLENGKKIVDKLNPISSGTGMTPTSALTTSNKQPDSSEIIVLADNRTSIILIDNMYTTIDFLKNKNPEIKPIISETDGQPYVNNPHYIKFMKGDAPRYLVKVWKFKSINPYSFGFTLYANEFGKWVNHWPTLKMKEVGKDSEKVFQSKDVFTFGSDDDADLQLEFVSGKASRGNVKFRFHVEADTFSPDADDKINSVALDASSDLPKKVLRLGLTDETLIAIQNLNEYKGKNKKEVLESIRFELHDAFDKSAGDIQKYPNTASFLYPGAPILYDEGLLTEIEGQQFWKVLGLKPGSYRVTLQLNEYEDFDKGIIVTYDILLDDSPQTIGNINKEQVLRISAVPADFKVNICMKCSDMLSCLACMDNKIVTSYERK